MYIANGFKSSLGEHIEMTTVICPPVDSKEKIFKVSFLVKEASYRHSFLINFNGTHNDLCEKVCEYAENFDVDNFLEEYIKRRKDGTEPHCKISEICDIAKKINMHLKHLAINIRHNLSSYNNVIKNDLIKEAERLYNNTPNGGIVNADTILADKLEEANHKENGLALEVFRIWNESKDRDTIEKLFYTLTDIEFIDFLDECIEKTTKPADKLDSIVDYIIKNASYCNGNMWTATDKEICAVFGITEKDFIMMQGNIVDMLASCTEVCDLNDVGPGMIDISLHKQYCVE